MEKWINKTSAKKLFMEIVAFNYFPNLCHSPAKGIMDGLLVQFN